MFLSIIIPAYNESSIIENSLEKIQDFLSKKDFEYEIIIINVYGYNIINSSKYIILKSSI